MKQSTLETLQTFTNPDGLNIQLKASIARLEVMSERSGNSVVPYAALLALCAQYDTPDKAELPDLPEDNEDVVDGAFGEPTDLDEIFGDEEVAPAKNKGGRPRKLVAHA